MIIDVQPNLWDKPAKRLPSDICANRHRNAPASVEANTRVDKNKDRAAVLEVIRRKGVTYSKEIAREMQKPLNAVSGRISELLALNVIQRTDDRYEGCQGICLK